MSKADDGAGVKLDYLHESEVMICDECGDVDAVPSALRNKFAMFHHTSCYLCRKCCISKGMTPMTLNEFLERQGCDVKDKECAETLTSVIDDYVRGMLDGKIQFFVDNNPVTFKKLPNGFYYATPVA